MKKLISFLCVFALALALVPAAFAEWDLSGMSFEDLIALRAQTQLEMMNRSEWQEVEVPQGLYVVGTDIPAGKWTIRAVDMGRTNIHVGLNTNEAKTELVYPYKVSEYVYSTNSRYYDAGDKTELALELSDGDYVHVGDGPAVFTTYAGQPSLGFKWQ
jgi:hypothetical protein